MWPPMPHIQIHFMSNIANGFQHMLPFDYLCIFPSGLDTMNPGSVNMTPGPYLPLSRHDWDPFPDKMLIKYLGGGAQLLIVRVVNSRLRGCWFEPHWGRCFVSLSKTFYPLLSTDSTQEDSSRHNWKMMTVTYETISNHCRKIYSRL